MHMLSILALSACVQATPLGGLGYGRLQRRAAASKQVTFAASAEYLCDVKSQNVEVVRDLGFVGKLGDYRIRTWGDSQTPEGLPFYMTSGSSSIDTDDPCKVLDTKLDGDHPAQFVPIMEEYGEQAGTDAMGGTNVVEIDPTTTTGMMFYLKNHRPGGINTIMGAGVAEVTMSGDVPSASRIGETMWGANEPWYGDITAYAADEFVWGLGHGGNGDIGQYSFLARAPKESYKDINAWKYFDGVTGEWTSNRQYNPTSDQALQWNDEEGAVWGVGQGQMIWSEYYKKILFVYGGNWANDEGDYNVYARTADRPRGPWSKPTILYTVKPLKPDSQVYCMVANPWYDSTGKTMIVTVSNSAATIQATKVTFT